MHWYVGKIVRWTKGLCPKYLDIALKTFEAKVNFWWWYYLLSGCFFVVTLCLLVCGWIGELSLVLSQGCCRQKDVIPHTSFPTWEARKLVPYNSNGSRLLVEGSTNHFLNFLFKTNFRECKLCPTSMIWVSLFHYCYVQQA